jgi:DNA-binding XRE family transcriptional regulator
MKALVRDGQRGICRMTVVEFERRRRRRVERKDMGMYGTVGGDLGFTEGDLDRARGARSSRPDSEMVARTEALARWIREHREAFACSQQEFARESGISRATLSKIEQGHIYPSMQVRRKLAKALGVGPQELWNLRSEALTGRDGESTKQAS